MVASRWWNWVAQGQRAGARRIRVPDRLTSRAGMARRRTRTVRATVKMGTAGVVPAVAVQRMRLWARTAQHSQAELAEKFPDGTWSRPAPSLRLSWLGAAATDENGVWVWPSSGYLGAASPSLRLKPGAFPAPQTVVTCTPHSIVDRKVLPGPAVGTEREGVMDLIVERCAGIDVGKAEIVACVRTPGPGGRRSQEIRTYTTFTAHLEALAEWLSAEGVTEVVMEATGSYWKAPWYVLEGAGFDLKLVNARHVKILPGRKTDVGDAAWLAELLEHGLLRSSFVPPAAIRELRDLTRYRKRLIQTHTSEAQRIEKTLEDAGIKLDVVASDILGVSGRAMLDALVAGERDPERLSDLAKGSMRRKIPLLREALHGRFSDHHALIVGLALDNIRHLETSIAKLDARIDEVMVPFSAARNRLDTITGVGKRAAEVIIAEIGADMSRFPTAGHLASWAGMCPGNNVTGGKRRSSRTQHGNVWLRDVLTECAWGASHSRDTYLNSLFWRLARRMGKRRACIAVGHTILVMAWHLLTNECDYEDLGGDYFARRESTDRRQDRLVRQLQEMGYQVTLRKTAA